LPAGSTVSQKASVQQMSCFQPIKEDDYGDSHQQTGHYCWIFKSPTFRGYSGITVSQRATLMNA
jgi:hypothetical protein